MTSELKPPSTRASDRQVLEHLAQECSHSGYRIAFDLLGTAADAEDAVQESLAIACMRIGTLQEPKAKVAWFHQILVRYCLRRLRRRKVGKVLSLLWPGEAIARPEFIPDSRASAESSLQTLEKRRKLWQAVHALPARQKAALVLRYGHEQSVGEIAEILGIGVGSVKTHLRRGLQALREEKLGEQV